MEDNLVFVFNLNEYILVKLDEKGYEHWLAKSNEFLPDRLKVSISELKSRADRDGYVSFQAWQFIKDFGETICFGYKPPFTTDIRIEKRYLKPLLNSDKNDERSVATDDHSSKDAGNITTHDPL